MYSQCAISVFVAQYITARGHTKVLHILKILLSAITLVFSEPLMTSNRYPAERFGRAQNGPTFDRQNTIFAASKLLDEIASGRLNPNIWDHWGINKHIRQNYFLVHIHFKLSPYVLEKLLKTSFGLFSYQEVTRYLPARSSKSNLELSKGI